MSSPIRVRLQDVVRPQLLTVEATKVDGIPVVFNPGTQTTPGTVTTNIPDRRILFVYAGWLPIAYQNMSSDLDRTEVFSFIPDEQGRIFEFDPGNQDRGFVDTVVTASLSSFAGEPDTAAVDFAQVTLEGRSFDGIQGEPQVLILRVPMALAGGVINGISYHVTVRAHPALVINRHEPLGTEHP